MNISIKLNLLYRFVLLGLISMFAVTCSGPVTYVFIDYSPSLTLTPVSMLPTESSANLTGTITPAKLPPSDLTVDPHVDLICDGKSQLLEVNVRLGVSGGIPPFTIDGKEIDSSKPIFTLNAGRYNEFDIESSDGQVKHMRVWAPSACDDTALKEVVNPATDPPATDPPATDPPATDPPATDPPSIPCPTNPAGNVPPGKCK